MITRASAHSPSQPSRTRGRPREFDIDQALDRAISVFRERGYHATSISDLSDATHLTAGSIYKAFKDKRAVFLAALDRYSTCRSQLLRQAANTTKPGRDRIRDVLAFYVDASQGAEGRQGCLIIGTATELATLDTEVAARITSALRGNENFLADLIRAGQDDDSIPRHVDAEATARLITCLTQGLRVAGKTGRTKAELSVVIDVAMKLLT